MRLVRIVAAQSLRWLARALLVPPRRLLNLADRIDPAG